MSERAIRAVVDTIQRTFSAMDAEAWAACFRAPTVFVRAEGTTTAATRGDLVNIGNVIFDGLRARNFARTELEAVEVTSVTPGMALAATRWCRYTAAEDVLERLEATYVFVLDGADWKVAVLAAQGLTSHEEEE